MTPKEAIDILTDVVSKDIQYALESLLSDFEVAKDELEERDNRILELEEEIEKLNDHILFSKS